MTLVEVIRSQLFESHLDPLLSGSGASTCCSGITRLHLKHSPEQIVGVCCQELDLSIGVKAVQVRALRRQALVDVCMVSLVVRVRWQRESRRQVQLSLKLKPRQDTVLEVDEGTKPNPCF